MNIPLDYTIKIPFIQEKPFYAIRLIPYFKNGDMSFSIPTIQTYWNIDEDTGHINIDTDSCSLTAIYDAIHPGYKITRFLATYDYIVALLENIHLEIQVSQHLIVNPLNEIHLHHFNEQYGFEFFKDGITSEVDITTGVSYLSLTLNTIVLSSVFSTYARTAFLPVSYPLHKSMLLTSLIASPKEDKRKWKIPGITYDDSFYEKIGVPSSRAFWVTLHFSSSIQQEKV